MFNKHPAAVVNGDGAMREAIKVVFPNAAHRLCGWHLNKNACENVKNPKFLDDFKKAMYSNFTPERFEQFWEEMVNKHGLQGNRWVLKTYDIKEMWASAYLRDKFFARIRTTSQCEGINSLIKTYVRSKNTIIEFIHNFEQSLREYRYKGLTSDFNSLYTVPILTTSLQKIENQASKVFTLDIFKDVKLEHIDAIPPSMICKRWRKDVKSDMMIADGLDEVEPDMMRKYENLCSVSSTSTVEINVVYDPTVVKTKGASTKARKRQDEVNVNPEVSVAESESLMRDADNSEEGVAFDHNVTDRSSNHMSRRISDSGNVMLPNEGSCVAHGLFPLFPTQPQVHINTQQSTNEVANDADNRLLYRMIYSEISLQILVG
ncbi:FAR1-related protein [Sesbania bispinosa]|nr:FAR1-related protein [Sesbania bispinosa]